MKRGEKFGVQFRCADHPRDEAEMYLSNRSDGHYIGLPNFRVLARKLNEITLTKQYADEYYTTIEVPYLRQCRNPSDALYKEILRFIGLGQDDFH